MTQALPETETSEITENSHEAEFRERITTITRRRVGDIDNNPRNPKRYTGEKKERLTAVLSQFGKAGVLLTYFDDDGTERFFDGNTRLDPDEVWHIAQTDLTQAEVNDLVMLYDPLAAPDWEAELLKMLVEETAVDRQDAPLLADMMDEIMAELAAGLEPEPPERGDAEPGVTEAEADKYQEIWQVKEGDVWRIGRHLVACIDCLDETAVSQFLDGVMVNFVWADPPYGISAVKSDGRVAAHGEPRGGYPFGGTKNTGKGRGIPATKYSPVIGDDTTATARRAATVFLAMASQATHVWWGANFYADAMPPSSCWIVWDKERENDLADAELAWCSHVSAVRIFHHMWNGMVKASEHGQRRVHPTQKPIALAHWAFGKYGDEGDVIFDPFLGSGISVLAAEELGDGRIVYGCDLAPAYVATTIQRWVAMTGGEPELVT